MPNIDTLEPFAYYGYEEGKVGFEGYHTRAGIRYGNEEVWLGEKKYYGYDREEEALDEATKHLIATLKKLFE